MQYQDQTKNNEPIDEQGDRGRQRQSKPLVFTKDNRQAQVKQHHHQREGSRDDEPPPRAQTVDAKKRGIMKNHLMRNRMVQTHDDPGPNREAHSGDHDSRFHPRRPEPEAKTATDWQAHRLFWLGAGLLATIHFVLVVHSGLNDSQTFDEGVHLAAGVSYWRTGDLRLNPEHPILWKAIAALPVLLTNPSVPTDTLAWREHREWEFADVFMHENRVSTTTLLMLGRLPTMLVSAGLILLLAWFGWRLAGPRLGLTAAWLAAFDPTLIAHGHLITTDVPVTFFIVLTISQLFRYVHAPSWKTLLALLVSVWTASLVKYSALFLFLAVPLLLFFWRKKMTLTMKPGRLFGLLVGSTTLVLFLVYGFRLQRVGDDPRINQIFALRQQMIDEQAVINQPALIQRLVAATEPGTPLRRTIAFVENIHLPFYWYIRGVAAVVSHAYWGQEAYLLGQTSPRGWSWYFPVAWVVKTPAVTLAGLVVTASALGTWRIRRQPLPKFLTFLTLPLLLYALFSLTSHLNLGIRHLLPLYPFLFLLIGTIWIVELGRTTTVVRGLMLLMLSFLPLTTAFAHPRELAYFSEFVGGDRYGHRYLLDSNLDWGQDLYRLHDWMVERRIASVALAYAGTARPRNYGVRDEPLPDREPQADELTSRYAVISLGKLIGSPDRFAWLLRRPRWERIGSSLIVFDLLPR